MLEDDELIGIAKAAELAGVTEDYLRKQAQVKRLKAKKIGRDWVTTRAAVNEWKNNAALHKRGKRAKSD